jgi:hypothetical protein
VTVTHHGGVPEGLASMLGELIATNLERHPDRIALLRPASVALAATDAGVAVTLRMSDGAVEVEQGADRRAQILVATEGRWLLEMAAAPLRWGLPDPVSAEGRRVIAGIVSGRIRIRGLLRHPALVRRLSMLLSVA